MKHTTINWLKLTVMVLDEAAILVLVLLMLYYSGALAKIPLSVTIVISIALVVVVFLIHLAVMPLFHKKPVTGIESMIGMKCKVTEALTPSGMVIIKGEYWRAESLKGNIDTGEMVEIVESDGLILKVRRTS